MELVLWPETGRLRWANFEYAFGARLAERIRRVASAESPS